MTTLQQLDDVLDFFYDNPKVWNIIEINNNFSAIDREDLICVIDKLYSDKFLIPRTGTYTFQISFTGKLFKESGGYVRQKEINDEKDNQMKNIEMKQMELQTSVRDLTRWLAVATVVIGIQALIWIVDYFSNHYLHK